MIKWEATRHIWSEERPVSSVSLPIISEGLGLVSTFEGGVNKVGLATGSTTDVFEGICLAPRKTFSLNAKTESVVAPAGGGIVLLTRTAALSGGSGIGVYNASTYAEVVASSAAVSPTNIQTGTDGTTGLTTLNFDPSLAGVTFWVSYQYVMNAIELQGSYGDSPGAGQGSFAATDLLGQTGVFKIGQVALGRMLNDIFKPKDISSSMLRHIWLTHKYGDVNLDHLIQSAHNMGNSSINQILKYVQKPGDKVESDE